MKAVDKRILEEAIKLIETERSPYSCSAIFMAGKGLSRAAKLRDAYSNLFNDSGNEFWLHAQTAESVLNYEEKTQLRILLLTLAQEVL